MILMSPFPAVLTSYSILFLIVLGLEESFRTESTDWLNWTFLLLCPESLNIRRPFKVLFFFMKSRVVCYILDQINNNNIKRGEFN